MTILLFRRDATSNLVKILSSLNIKSLFVLPKFFCDFRKGFEA